MRRDNFRIILAFVFPLIILLFVVSLVSNLGSDILLRSLPISGIVFISLFVSIISGVVAVLTTRVLYRNPTALSIALLGLPNSGKTTYLTLLFSSLYGSSGDLQFTPYGVQTVEQVQSDMDKLLQREWLPKTSRSSIFTYRANAALGRGLFRRHYKIEIGDYAGEYTEELGAVERKWLHRTDYFRFVVQSDAVMLAIDSQVLLGVPFAIRTVETDYVSALLALMDEKGITATRMINIPIAILFMKYDLALNELDALGQHPDIEYLSLQIPRLVSLCRGRCKHFAMFGVSAVGTRGTPGEVPPIDLEPIGVVEPMEWLLSRTGVF